MADKLTRKAASDAVTDLGWRYVLAALCTTVEVASLAHAAEIATRVIAAAGPDAGEHVLLDMRRERLAITVQTLAAATTTARDVELARRISAAVTELGLRTDAAVGADPRCVQRLEIAIDALDIPAVRPFWKAVTGYEDEPGAIGPAAIVDRWRQGPAIWFQQMDAPRPQRNRIHLDLSVPHDEARRRIDAALAAGGRVVSDSSAPAFWVLADAEGNEVCITTWQGRD